ncbi:hypothetical protein MRX96_026230 [Rhipicephalus microplus]
MAKVNAGPSRANLELGEDDGAYPAGCGRLALGMCLAIAVMSAVTMALAVLDVPFRSVTRVQDTHKAALDSKPRPIPPPLVGHRGKPRNLAEGNVFGSVESTVTVDGEMTSTEEDRRDIAQSSMPEQDDK